MLNVVVLMGRLTRDPELARTSSDVPVVHFSIAVQRSFVAKGQDRQTDFFNVVAWRSTAEFVCKYFKKGNMIAVEGSIQTGSYEKDGIKRQTFDIVATNVHFVESKRSSDDSVSGDSLSGFSTSASFDSSSSDDDDDLPF